MHMPSHRFPMSIICSDIMVVAGLRQSNMPACAVASKEKVVQVVSLRNKKHGGHNRLKYAAAAAAAAAGKPVISAAWASELRDEKVFSATSPQFDCARCAPHIYESPIIIYAT